MKKFNQLLSILAATLTITSCATMGNIVEPTYSFQPADNQGLVALTVDCRYENSNISFYYRPVSEIPKDALGILRSSCSKKNRENKDYKIILSALPQGSYKIYDWVINLNGRPDRKTVHPIYFNIRKHKVTYIGRIHIETGYNNNYVYFISNQSVNDLPKVKLKAPLINKKNYRVRIAKIKDY